MSARILRGDCMATLPTLAADSVHAVVTDPPYHLQSIHKRFAKVGRDDKTRTTSGPHQRTASGFMNKMWDGGDISFRPETWASIARVMRPGAHLVAFGGTRTFHRIAVAIEDAGFEIRDTLMWVYGSGFPKSHNQQGEWEGWGTALKPAWEPIILARKPLVGTVGANVAAHGTGAINVDACRVGTEGATKRSGQAVYPKKPDGTEDRSGVWARTGHAILPVDAGRWPANVVHDGSDDVLGCFPVAPGQQGRAKQDDTEKTNTIYGKFARNETKLPEPRGDAGSAARFFYCAKASRTDRDDGGAKNNHPTVKPTTLMRWLCRMVTPPGGTILDPFMGSGSTGRGALAEGFDFIGCEADEGYADIAQTRIAPFMSQTEVFEDLVG